MQRRLDRLEDVGDAAAGATPKASRTSPGVLDRDEELGKARELHAERRALAEEILGEPAVVSPSTAARPAEEVVQLVRVSRNRSQRRLDLLDCPEVERLLGAPQLP